MEKLYNLQKSGKAESDSYEHSKGWRNKQSATMWDLKPLFKTIYLKSFDFLSLEVTKLLVILQIISN